MSAALLTALDSLGLISDDTTRGVVMAGGGRRVAALMIQLLEAVEDE